MMILYATVLEPAVPGALGHILAASVMSVPAAIVMAHIMVPRNTPRMALATRPW